MQCRQILSQTFLRFESMFYVSHFDLMVSNDNSNKWWLVWRSGNGVHYINEVKLWYLSRPLRPTQPGHPSVGRCNEYRRWFWPSL